MADRVVIIGGGAAGMTAAIQAAGLGHDVTILERNAIPGKKILATGNGRCNFTNQEMSVRDFYTDEPRMLAEILEEYPPQSIISFFYDLGVLYKERNGYCYPRTDTAATVRDMLELRLQELRVSIKTNCVVKHIRTAQEHRFCILTSQGEFHADHVIVACGGMASPKTGSDGYGYDLLQELGIASTDKVPALVQLVAKESYCKNLAGIRAEALVWLHVENRNAYKGIIKDIGEIQLTDYGISGIPVFQISGTANQILQSSKEVVAYVDFLHTLNKADLERLVAERKTSYAGSTVDRALDGLVHKKLLLLSIRLCGINPEQKVRDLSEEDMLQILRKLKKMPFTIIGHKGFEQAQVTRGGIPMKALHSTLETKKIPGLYVCGELCNVDGKCGGYNLHFAWASGLIAGRLGDCNVKNKSSEM